MTISGLATLSLTGGLAAAQLRLHSRRMMIALSHAIEEHAAASGPETVLVAAFQRLSLLRPEAERYARLAPRLAQVIALGFPDVTPEPIPGVTVLPLEPAWPLVQEWCVIASGPACCAALLSRDAEGFRPDRRSRQFRGRWTTEPAEVDLALRQLFAAIGQPHPSLQRDRRASLQTANAIRAALARGAGG
jgi:DICT domain-containing protein